MLYSLRFRKCALFVRTNTGALVFMVVFTEGRNNET